MSTVLSSSRFVSFKTVHAGVSRSHQIDLPGFHFHQTATGPFERLLFEHVHEKHTIFAVLAGSTRWSSGVTEGASREEKPDFAGATTFIPATRRHRSMLVKGNFVSVCLGIDPLLIEAACGERIERWHPSFNAKSNHLFAEMKALCQLAALQNEVPMAILEGTQLSIARSVARAFAGFRSRADDARLNPSAFRRVLEMLEQPLASRLPLENMAREAGLSVSAFARAFRGSIGVTPGQYIQKQRMARARHLLMRTDQSPSSIAAHLGFSDTAHFSNAFRRMHDCSPGEFRTRSGD